MNQIHHVVHLMLENRSLDNLLGWLYEHDEPRNWFPEHNTAPFDGLVEGRDRLPLRSRRGVEEFTVGKVRAGSDLRVPGFNPNEAYPGVLNQQFGTEDPVNREPEYGTVPRMRGFLQDYSAWHMSWDEALEITQAYTPEQLPIIHALAKNFAISDRWYSSVPTDTNPNRAFSLCGTSLGRDRNENMLADETFDAPTLFNRFAERGVKWGLYYQDVWRDGKCYTHYTFPHIEAARVTGEIADMKQFFAHAQAGKLPAFTYLEPSWSYGKGRFYKQGDDFHPPARVTPGEQLLARVYAALRGSPNWAKTLLIVTFDEHGGTYDHAPPPWGAINPDRRHSRSGFAFNRFGVRIPTLLISPYVAPGTVFRSPTAVPFDHTSVIKTLLEWKGIDPATAKLGERMLAAPSFAGVLAAEPVNHTGPIGPSGPMLAQASASERGDLSEHFEGVPAVIVRAIFERSESTTDVFVALEAWRRSPDEQERELLGG